MNLFCRKSRQKSLEQPTFLPGIRTKRPGIQTKQPGLSAEQLRILNSKLGILDRTARNSKQQARNSRQNSRDSGQKSPDSKQKSPDSRQGSRVFQTFLPGILGRKGSLPGSPGTRRAPSGHRHRVRPLREMKGMLPNRLRPLVLERGVGAAGRCTEHNELLASNHLLFWLSTFGAELETRLRVHRTEP